MLYSNYLILETRSKSLIKKRLFQQTLTGWLSEKDYVLAYWKEKWITKALSLHRIYPSFLFLSATINYLCQKLHIAVFHWLKSQIKHLRLNTQEALSVKDGLILKWKCLWHIRKTFDDSFPFYVSLHIWRYSVGW